MSDLSFKHAALVPRLGTFGWNNLILTPSYGARQRLIAIVTEAKLEQSELSLPEKLYNPELCGYTCVKACQNFEYTMRLSEKYQDIHLEIKM